jgi:hypothetical protein
LQTGEDVVEEKRLASSRLSRDDESVESASLAKEEAV